jgi:hypothetical protein
MTPSEQEALFIQLRRRFPDWSSTFTSGYVHGASDEGDRRQPRKGYLGAARRHDEYALGYIVGFAIRRGIDAEQERWLAPVGTILAATKRSLGVEK